MKREYKPRSQIRVQYLLDWVPPDLMRKVKAKARREKISVRKKLLDTLRRWVRT